MNQIQNQLNEIYQSYLKKITDDNEIYENIVNSTIYSPLFINSEAEVDKYIESGIWELDQEKLPVLLTNKYQSLEDAKEILGEASDISKLFIEFQQHLYNVGVA